MRERPLTLRRIIYPHPGRDEAGRPPLADSLFSNSEPVYVRARGAFPQMHAILPYLIRRSGQSVEQVLQRLQDEAPSYPVRHIQLAAVRYYLQYLMTEIGHTWYTEKARGITNHGTLLDQIRHGRRTKDAVCLITFNYDTLIEQALGNQADTIPGYISDDRFKLFKLHGSVNWGRKVTSRISSFNVGNDWQIAEEIIANAATLTVSDDYEITNGIPPGGARDRPLAPAIAIPILKKDRFECPAAHSRMLSELIPRTDKILTIGWRATEDHFLDVLSAHLKPGATIIACSGTRESAVETLDKLRAKHITAHFEPLAGGFSEMIADRQVVRFLEGC